MKQIRKYKDKILLLGFNSDYDEIKLSEGITIRRASDEELIEIFERLKQYQYENQRFIIEFNYSETNESIYPAKLFRLLDDLNLFFKIFFEGKTKVAFALRHILINDEFKSCGFSTNPKVWPFFSEEYHLKSVDFEKIVQLWTNYQRQAENKAMQIALRRFNFSIEKHEYEDQIIDLMIAFEALFTRENEKNISKKLAKRVSILLLESYNPNKVYHFFRDMYKIRSQIIHGSIVEVESKFKNEQLYMQSLVATLSHFLSNCFHQKIVNFTLYSREEMIIELDKENNLN